MQVCVIDNVHYVILALRIAAAYFALLTAGIHPTKTSKTTVTAGSWLPKQYIDVECEEELRREASFKTTGYRAPNTVYTLAKSNLALPVQASAQVRLA